MRFLLDAQLSRRLARRLVERGHEASHVFDHLKPDADDLTIAGLANDLGASVVSKDADFVDIAERGLLNQTLVWLRVPNLSDDLLWQRLDRGLPAIVSAVREQWRIVEIL